MRIYFDTEFTGLQQYTSLISIGLISETGKTFYAELTDYKKPLVDHWIQNRVVDNLRLNDFPDNSSNASPQTGYEVKGDAKYVADLLADWLVLFSDKGKDDSVEMWSDCLAYDWMLFCQLWGHAFYIPKVVYYIPFDLSTALKLRGEDPDVNREQFAFGTVTGEMVKQKHNALWDAKVIKACIEKLGI